MSTRAHRPNLFIVGAPKCGTTSLYHYLAQHPNVYMCPVKEPRYWSDDLRAQGRAFHAGLYRRHLRSWRGLLTLPGCAWRHRHIHPEQLLGIDSFEVYLALFDAADPSRHRYLGEASPDSLWSRTAAARIAAFNPDARIIIMLRDPVAYIGSIHREALSGTVGETVRSLDRALDLEARRRAGTAVPCTVRYPYSVFYRDQAHFDEQVQRFLDCFPKEQVHFVLLEDLAESAERAWRGVLDFLGLPVPPDRVDLTPRNVGTAPPRALSESWRCRLVDEFRPVVARLQAQTGLRLVDRWGYSRAAAADVSPGGAPQ
jgi:hypothetical protein